MLRAALALLVASFAAAPAEARADFGAETPSSEARQVADWALASGDSLGLPFLIVDKRRARVLAFDAGGRLRAAVPALLGSARGDSSPADIGTRKLAAIALAERITPAGRYVARLGRDLGGDVLWVDYAAALSLHRVVTGRATDRRGQRLASATPHDNRISYGCINVPVTFYDDVVQVLFGPANGIVYILPEIQSLATALPGFVPTLPAP